MRKKIALLILMVLALAMIGCSSDKSNYVENNSDTSASDGSTDQSGLDGAAGLAALVRVPVLFGIGETPLAEGEVVSKKELTESSLYLINPINGAAMLIGSTGYEVYGIAYDAITNKLYGIASPYKVADVKSPSVYGSQLIEINMATGEGTLIGDITEPESLVKGNKLRFSHPTFNLTGTLYAWNEYKQALCTIDLRTAEAHTFSHTFDSYPSGLAFNNLDVLYLFYAYKKGGSELYIINPYTGEESYVRDLDELTYNGDINPLTGQYWSIDDIYSFPRNLVVMDMYTGNFISTIPTAKNLEAITFGFLDVKTLTLLGLNMLSDFIIQTPPE